jgi:RNA polymerase sigma factor (sigma-70 family)
LSIVEGLAPMPMLDRFRMTMLPHMDAAYNYACYLSRDLVLAEDVTQDAFLKAFRSFDNYRGGSAKAWLFAIVRNCFHDATKARGTVMSEATYLSEAADPSDPETVLLGKHDVEQVRTAIAKLAEPFRETLILRELEALSYKEIAALTEVPIGTVMSRLARARKLLGPLLSAAADTSAAVLP